MVRHHLATTITPLALLIPMFGEGESALPVGESLAGWKPRAAALVLFGLAVVVCWPLLQKARLRR